MILDELRLPAYLHRSFFKNKLIDTRNSILNPGESEKKTLVFLGENAKKHVYLVDEKKSAFLAENDLPFFLQLVEACKFTLADVAVLNKNDKPDLTYKEIVKSIEAITLVGFGIEATDIDLPFTIPHYQVQKFENTSYMFAPALATLVNNPVEKKSLWIAFQKIYNL